MILPYGWFDQYMYADLFKMDNVDVHWVNKPMNNKFLAIARKVHKSKKVNRIIHLPCQAYWETDIFQKIDDDTCIIFNTGVLMMLEKDFLYQIKSTSNAKMVLLIVDSMHGSSVHMKYVRDIIMSFPWDIKLSYDKKDCAEFGFTYMPGTIYSKLDINMIKKPSVMSDIQFVGRNKQGRNDVCMDLYHRLVSEGVICNFTLVDSKKNLSKYKKYETEMLRISCKNIKYEEILTDVLGTNCILELVAGEQKQQTARYYEAVCYNKKLLTNNPFVKELSFYNPQYMKVFTTIDEIDYDWIKVKENVNYHYNNEFSPVNILSMITEI